jgi:RHS repeat-associated protein
MADGTVVEHAYDADGNRVRTEVTPATGPPRATELLVDSSAPLSQVVAEIDSAGNLTAYYFRGIDLLSVMRPTGPSTWSTRYYHADGVGSIRKLTDESGNVTDSYTYSAFGELLEHTGSDPQPYAFTAEPLDPNTRFQYHRARWLDPSVGRFTGTDPFGGDAFDPPSLHRYLYAFNAPVTFVDPTGLFGEFSIGGMLAVAGIIGVLTAIGTIAYGWFNYNRMDRLERGNIIHKAIYPFYEAFGFLCNRWIAKSDNPPIDQRRPDCRHHGPGPFAGDVYEIKSIVEVAIGAAQVLDYIAILTARYPGVPWHPGITLLAPTPLALPEFPFILLDLSIPVPGVIAYSPRADYGKAARWGAAAFVVTLMILALRAGGPKSQRIPVPQRLPKAA